LIDATVNSKKLSFGGSNIYNIMNHFDDRFIVHMNVWNGSSNIVFDAHVRYDNEQGRIIGCFESDIVKIFDMILNIFLSWIKRKSIRIGISKTISWREFVIKWIKIRKEFVLLIIYINKRTIQMKSLFECQSFEE